MRTSSGRCGRTLRVVVSAAAGVVVLVSGCKRVSDEGAPMIVAEAPKPVVVDAPPPLPPPEISVAQVRPPDKPKPTVRDRPVVTRPREPVEPRPEPETKPEPIKPEPRVVTPTPTPTPPARGAGRVSVRTIPDGATIRLIDNDGKKVAEQKTPATIAVTPGSYEWEIELAGFVSEGSAPEKISVTAGALETLTRTLAPAGDRQQILARADAAYKTPNGAGCAQAISLYDAIQRPADVSGAVGSEWVTAQLRIAQCSAQLREWTRALNATALVRKARPREWTAKYYEGQTLCRMGQWERGIVVLRDMAGETSTLAVDERQVVPLLSIFETAECDRAEYEASKQPERLLDLKDRFLDEFELFIEGAKRMESGGGFPADHSGTLKRALKNAQDVLTKYNAGRP